MTVMQCPKCGASIDKSKSFSFIGSTFVSNQTEIFNLNGELYAMDLAKRTVAYHWP
jgi:hypothetical protein